MGMFDDLRIVDDARFTCAAGHKLEKLQTKDLDCSMDQLVLYKSKLYRQERSEKEGEIVLLGKYHGRTSEDYEPGELYTRRDSRLAPLDITQAVQAYGYCDECDPVLFVQSRANMFGDMVGERQGWNEVQLNVIRGELVDVSFKERPTRAQLMDQMRNEGLDVLADTERLAKLHLARKNK